MSIEPLVSLYGSLNSEVILDSSSTLSLEPVCNMISLKIVE